MRKFITILILAMACFNLGAQLVTTVAGQPEIAGAIDGAAFDATFNNPHGIAIGLDGIVYVTDRWSHTIRKIELDGTVSTFAGSPGISGDQDGEQAIALFNEPWGLCVGPEGNIYVADTRNNKIRKITPEGIVTTVAGSGNYGTSNGMGTAATFGNPTGIEIDNEGNIYVADHLTHIIRKIDELGYVTTLAGKPYQMGDTDGIGNQASFRRPYGLTLDNDGNILVADEWNHKIRRITPEGLVTTVAGTGEVGHQNGLAQAAGFNYPWDMTVDSLGNIFVADGYNYLIRKITPQGQVSTYAGTLEATGATDGEGTNATFSGATAIDFSPVTKELYIGDAYNNLVRKITDLEQDVSINLPSGNSIVCQDDYISINAFPNIYSSYHFYVNNQVAQSSSNPTFETNLLPPGIHKIQVLASDNSGTSSSNEISIQVLAAIVPTISTVGPTQFFEGDSVILIASFGETYFWSTGETTPTITVRESGIYSVEVEDQNGCTGSSIPVEVLVLENPEAAVIRLEGESVFCENEKTVLVSSSDENNQWLKDGWEIDNANEKSCTIDDSGTYQVQVTHASGIITISEPVTLTVLPSPELDFSVSEVRGTTLDSFNFKFTNPEITTVEWVFGDGNYSSDHHPTHQYKDEGYFSVELRATGENGCKDSLIQTDLILIENNTNDSTNLGNPNNPNLAINNNSNPDFFLPTAFTPNGDGENDLLFVRSQNIQNINMMIFNQWGEMIFQSFSQSIGWDGTANSKAAQIGNYVFLLEYTNQDGLQKRHSGHVTLLR